MSPWWGNSETERQNIWKFTTFFLRKKSTNTKQKDLDSREGTENNTNKAEFENAEILIHDNDGENLLDTDSCNEAQKSEGSLRQHELEMQRVGNQVNCTYNNKTSKKGLDLLDLEFPVLQLDKSDKPSSIRPLQRGESFPGRQAAGTLSKHEARRRLLSWKKTTIVRKNSEQQ